MLSRMKFDIDTVVNEILDQLPKSVWTSKTTTFLDPAIGGGQFVRVIEQRLKASGHDDTNIRSRVFGFEESELHIRYAVNKHKLVGQYIRKPYDEFLELETDMKFDVVVGNPPYQRPDNAAKRWTLWNEFVVKSKQLSDTVALVVPQSITGPGTLRLISDHCQHLNLDVSKYFPAVGSTFCYFIIDNTHNGLTNITSNNQTFNIDIKDKPFLPVLVDKDNLLLLDQLLSRPRRKWSRGEFHTSNKHHITNTGVDILHTNAQTLSSTTFKHDNLDKIRVAVTLSGYPTFTVVNNCYLSQAMMWTEFDNINDAQQYADLCNDSIIQNILSTFKWSGWNSKDVISLL